MATTLIQNGAIAGAIGAILEGRPVTEDDPANFATQANAADAFGDAFLTANAALTAPMADADNAEIGQLCEAVCKGILSGRNLISATATDYASLAAGAAAAAKATVAKLA
jgi:hypothetical protein